MHGLMVGKSCFMDKVCQSAHNFVEILQANEHFLCTSQHLSTRSTIQLNKFHIYPQFELCFVQKDPIVSTRRKSQIITQLII